MSRMRWWDLQYKMRKGDMIPRTERTGRHPPAYGAERDQMSTDSAEKRLNVFDAKG